MTPDPYEEAPDWWKNGWREWADTDPGPLPEPGYETDAAGDFTGEPE